MFSDFQKHLKNPVSAALNRFQGSFMAINDFEYVWKPKMAKHLYRVSFNSLRTLWALLNIKNEGKGSSKSYRFKDEGCDFHSQLLFFSYVEANVFYSPWHLKLLKHEISSWSYICPSVKKINIHPTVSFFWLYAHSCVIAQKLPQNTQFLKNIDTRIKTILKLSTL